MPYLWAFISHPSSQQAANSYAAQWTADLFACWIDRLDLLELLSIARYVCNEVSIWSMVCSRPGPCLTTVTWRWRKNCIQWKRSFLWKLRCHWLKILRQRQIAVVRQGPGDPFRFNCPLWGNPPGDRIVVVWYFLCRQCKQTVQRTVDTSMIWDSMTLIWRHCMRLNEFPEWYSCLFQVGDIMYHS